MRTTPITALPAPDDADFRVMCDLASRTDAVEAKIILVSRMLAQSARRLERLETVRKIGAPIVTSVVP